MIAHPKSGQRVELHFRESLRPVTPHLATGTVILAGRGRGPLNHLVLLDDGRLMVVPCGNLTKLNH